MAMTIPSPLNAAVSGSPVNAESAIIIIDDESEVDAEENNGTLVPMIADVQQLCLTDDEVCGSLIGITKSSIDEIYLLYKRHACCVGFSVRKSTGRTFRDGSVKEKYFVCSNAGFMNKTKAKNSKQVEVSKQAEVSKKVESSKQVSVTRTNCGAHLRVKRTDEGLFEVIDHDLSHNHVLLPMFSHLHRSERKISIDKGNAIETMLEAGVRPIDTYRLMVHEAGGEQLLGHTKRDHFNFINRLKMQKIDGEDSQNVLEILLQRAADEQDFFYRVKLDDHSRLQNLFWRDSMMKEDYQVYGDVVVFDTTYQVNKYNLICAPFVGVNNHWKNVIFGTK